MTSGPATREMILSGDRPVKLRGKADPIIIAIFNEPYGRALTFLTLVFITGTVTSLTALSQFRRRPAGVVARDACPGPKAAQYRC